MKRLIILALLLAMGCAPAVAATPGTVVAYSATWCGPCQAAKPELAKLRARGITVKVVDCSNQAPADIKALPTYRVYSAEGKLLKETNSIISLKLFLKLLKWLI